MMDGMDVVTDHLMFKVEVAAEIILLNLPSFIQSFSEGSHGPDVMIPFNKLDTPGL